MKTYSKAVVAFAATVLSQLITAVTATPHHSLGEVGTLGWLLICAAVLGVTTGVWGVTNQDG
jgi:hypothetical protein